MSAPAAPDLGFVEPAYGTRSLGDVVPAVATALGLRIPGGGTDGATTRLELPDAESYVVFLVDGLGARLIERYAHVAPYLATLLGRSTPGTAGVPSTTATSLTSLGTGLPPGAHGLVGFSARVPGTGTLLNHLFWDASVDPEEWQPHPTALGTLARAGAEVTTVNKREFQGSPLTQVSTRGATFVGADRVGERIAAAVASSARRPSLTYLYDSDLDWTGHRYGVASAPWLQQLAMVDAEAEHLREALPPSCRLLIVADHGMVDLAPDQRIDVDDDPALLDGVAMVGGEARFRHLYARPGAADDIAATWRSHLGDRAEVLTREEAVARGWFGRVDPVVAPRLGDVVVAGREVGVFSRRLFEYETTLVGLHGSLSADEMLIPFLVD
ncbi:alkaline phosphatase family protein [Nocardioides sp.]|uniref:alkaline phosphatase family protein n=1 Tax=Nocardioides sp. TaxID=35761 RepID=UPI0035171F07